MSARLTAIGDQWLVTLIDAVDAPPVRRDPARDAAHRRKAQRPRRRLDRPAGPHVRVTTGSSRRGPAPRMATRSRSTATWSARRRASAAGSSSAAILELLTYETDAVVISTFVSVKRNGTYAIAQKPAGMTTYFSFIAQSSMLAAISAAYAAGEGLAAMRRMYTPGRTGSSRCSGAVHRWRAARHRAGLPRVLARPLPGRHPAHRRRHVPRGRGPAHRAAATGRRRHDHGHGQGRARRARPVRRVRDQPRAHRRARRARSGCSACCSRPSSRSRRDELPARAVPPPRRGHGARAAVLLGEQARSARAARAPAPRGSSCSRLPTPSSTSAAPAARRVRASSARLPRACSPSSSASPRYFSRRGPRLVRRDPPRPPLAHRRRPRHAAAGGRRDDGTTLAVVVPTFRAPGALSRAASTALGRQRRAFDEVVVATRGRRPGRRRRGARARRSRARSSSWTHPGSLAAMAAGAHATTSDVVCFTDDDAVPPADVARAARRGDCPPPRAVGGVGGRDVLVDDGVAERRAAAPPTSAGSRWFGRHVGGHHLGAGHARDVAFLKGVNSRLPARRARRSRAGCAARAPRRTSRSPSAATRARSATASSTTLRLVVEHHPADPPGRRPARRPDRAARSADAAYNLVVAIGGRAGLAASPTPRSSGTAARPARARARGARARRPDDRAAPRPLGARHARGRLGARARSRADLRDLRL